MKLAYVTPYDSRSLKGSNEWSGTGYYIAQSLKNQFFPLEYVGPLKNEFGCRLVQKYKRHYHELFHKKYLKNPTPCVLKSYAKQITSKLYQTNVDLIFSGSANPIAYLECKQPIVFWADASFASLLDFYPDYSYLCQETIRDWHRVEQLAHQKCQLAIYSSDWAAQTAINYYGVNEAKVKVVPFGANIETEYSLYEVKDLIEVRSPKLCKLLFLGVEWYRKGGDVALKVATELNKAGLNTELTVVGCQPITEEPLPNFVKPLGFISKSTAQGKAKISQLIAESHFLFLPSLADCTPIVLCEANALGVPCLTTNVGGIPTIIKDNLNGKTFDITANPLEYANYISNLFTNYSNYIELALSSFNEYQSRLNWNASGKAVKNLLLKL
ncbi:glycosyltransferase family 4 protein [Gloeocapsopsis sp. IPPAS B-1203]|uniref:glycosyltransferase family 4 protein n=1 Tax=Gloeocapsopsis sp. IPPAS B-1203 TaxID=2049454 RepID=UPI000C1A0BB2|nr:glycosyltransferase family 4 protein [Gloeocapsopsis sp. IPPAS B-1203]PIG92511.1 group 1 glycosyl transferase [Gloeocapsopsis sp. IPPAS B-1203]